MRNCRHEEDAGRGGPRSCICDEGIVSEGDELLSPFECHEMMGCHIAGLSKDFKREYEKLLRC